MPCNAVTNTTAKVSNKSFAKLMTPAMIRALAEAAVKGAGYENISVTEGYGTVRGTAYDPISGDNFDFTIRKSGDEIYITASEDGYGETVGSRKIAEILSAAIEAGFAILKSEFLAAAIKQAGAKVSSSTVKNNGTAVTMFEIDF